MNRDSRLIIRLNKAFLIYAFVIALPFRGRHLPLAQFIGL